MVERKKSGPKPRTHCVRGHEKTPEHTSLSGECMICRKERSLLKFGSPEYKAFSALRKTPLTTSKRPPKMIGCKRCGTDIPMRNRVVHCDKCKPLAHAERRNAYNARLAEQRGKDSSARVTSPTHRRKAGIMTDAEQREIDRAVNEKLNMKLSYKEYRRGSAEFNKLARLYSGASA